MNGKYFESNRFDGMGDVSLHDMVAEHANCILHNLMVCAAEPDKREADKEANAYHVMIALCEAGLSKLDGATVGKSRDFIAGKIEAVDPDEAAKRLILSIFGIKED